MTQAIKEIPTVPALQENNEFWQNYEQMKAKAEKFDQMATSLAAMVHHASVMINKNHPAMQTAMALLAEFNSQHTTVPNGEQKIEH